MRKTIIAENKEPQKGLIFYPDPGFTQGT